MRKVQLYYCNFKKKKKSEIKNMIFKYQSMTFYIIVSVIGNITCKTSANRFFPLFFAWKVTLIILNQYLAKDKVSCSRTKQSASSEAQTRNPSISRQALYHCATVLLKRKRKKGKILWKSQVHLTVNF